MKARMILLALAFCFAGVAACYASDDANLGTWKLNEAKSKIPAGAPKNVTVVYTTEGDQFKCVVDGVDGEGKPAHNEWVGKFDGKDYELKGDPGADTRSLKMVDAHHYQLTNKKAGKPTTTGTVEISADGKTRTVSTHSTTAGGKKLTTVFVYDKQ